jgi:hypothetical protein
LRPEPPQGLGIDDLAAVAALTPNRDARLALTDQDRSLASIRPERRSAQEAPSPHGGPSETPASDMTGMTAATSRRLTLVLCCAGRRCLRSSCRLLRDRGPQSGDQGLDLALIEVHPRRSPRRDRFGDKGIAPPGRRAAEDGRFCPDWQHFLRHIGDTSGPDQFGGTRRTSLFPGISSCRRRDSNPRHADYDSGRLPSVYGRSGRCWTAGWTVLSDDMRARRILRVMPRRIARPPAPVARALLSRPRVRSESELRIPHSVQAQRVRASQHWP